MYKVKSDIGCYMIGKINDCYYDTNGCYFEDLVNEQKGFYQKKYYLELFLEDANGILKFNKIRCEENGNTILFSKEEVMMHSFTNKRITVAGDDIKIQSILFDCINPEVFISYVIFILNTKAYYKDLLIWNRQYIRKSKIQFSLRHYEILYLFFLNDRDGIISSLINQHMPATLFSFFSCCGLEDNEKNIDAAGLENILSSKNVRCIINLARILEPAYQSFLDESLNRSANTKQLVLVLNDLITTYGTQDVLAMKHFMEVLIELNRQSRRPGKDTSIMSILERLINIKESIPNSGFSENVDYIFYLIFNKYQFFSTYNGFLEAVILWDDYLMMKNEDDCIYPRQLRQQHDEVMNVGNKQKISAISRLDFKKATQSYKNLEYISQNYEVRVPKDPAELQQIGERLNICVGAYISSVASKLSNILWVYKENHPIVALEVRQKKLVQAKACSNRRPAESDLKFIHEWCQKKNIEIVSY